PPTSRSIWRSPTTWRGGCGEVDVRPDRSEPAVPLGHGAGRRPDHHPPAAAAALSRASLGGDGVPPALGAEHGAPPAVGADPAAHLARPDPDARRPGAGAPGGEHGRAS